MRSHSMAYAPIGADLDTGNTKLIIGTTRSRAEELAKKVPRAHVVPTFNTVPREVLFGGFESKD